MTTFRKASQSDLLMPSFLLLSMLLLGCSCKNVEQNDDPPPTDEPSFIPLFLVLKSYLAVMIVIVAVIIILFMLQGSLVKLFGSIQRCFLKVTSVRDAKNENVSAEPKETEEINGNEFVNVLRPRKQSSLRMIDDVTPRLSFSDRQPDYLSCAPAPLATFARAESTEAEFPAALIESIKNRHVEPTLV